MKDIEPLMGRFSLETEQECLLLDEEIHTWFSRGREGRQAPVWIYFWNHGLIPGRWDILPLCKEDVPALYEYTRKWMGDDASNTSDEKLAGWLETWCGESLVESGHLWRAASMLQLEDPPERENGDNL